MTNRKSDDHYVDVPEGITKEQMLSLVERAADGAGLYISHIGGFSRMKFPNFSTRSRLRSKPSPAS